MSRKSVARATMPMLVRSANDIDRYIGKIRKAAADAFASIVDHTDDPLNLLRRMKFETIGFHPINGYPLNVIEQINQTWTYFVALEAARHLLQLHPEAGGYRLAPGADAPIPLDIMSEVDGLVGAETFAVVDLRNNDKLDKDLQKMAVRHEQHRYIFFMSPQYPGTKRLAKFEQRGVQVWSLDFMTHSLSPTNPALNLF